MASDSRFALSTSPKTEVFLVASSISLPTSSTLSASSLAASAASSMLSVLSSMASAWSRSALWLFSSSRSMPLSSAKALFNWICQFWVLRSFSPKEVEALSSADRSVSIFSFCASIVFSNISLRAVKAWMDLSFLSNWELIRAISLPKTLNAWLISRSAFLNSFSPSTPIFKPKLSAKITSSFRWKIKSHKE